MGNFNLEKKKVPTASGDIFYFINNSFPGRPFVIFLHGLSSNHTTWLKAMEILHENKYNSIAPDLRGHGFSDKSKNKEFYRMPIFSNDLREIIEKEKIDNFILVGYSFGGQIALDYILRSPKRVKGLILISVNHVNPLEYKGLKFLSPVTVWIFNLLAAFLLWQKKEKYYYYRHGEAVNYWDSVKDGLMTMPISVNLWMLSAVAGINFRDAIKNIKIPTVIVYGKNDFFITKKEVDDMAKAIKNAKIIISRNPSHFVGTNAQDETIEIILNFLNNKQI